MKKRKQLDHIGTRTVESCQLEAVGTDPCPVRNAMNAAPIKQELLSECSKKCWRKNSHAFSAFLEERKLST